MSEQPEQPQPKLSRTDFESMTHEQLAAMLDSADTVSVAIIATRLSDAASTITKIGEDLMKHVKNLEWQGKAGDSFRDWGGHTASSTLRLGDYAGAASRLMGEVSYAIGEAKSRMPNLEETASAKAVLVDAHKTIDAAKQPGARNDPDARKAAATAHSDATAAQAHIDAARQDAIQQMRKLAGAYEHSATLINSVTPPTFAPAAGRAAPGDWWIGDESAVAIGPSHSAEQASPGAASPAAHHRAVVRPTAAHDASAGPVLEVPVHPHGHTPVHPEPVSLNIDSADTLPRTSTPPLTAPPVGPVQPPRELSTPGLPVGLPPTFTGGGRASGAESLTRGPGAGRVPQVPGLARPIEGLPRMPRDSAIIGGRQVNANGRPANGIPRGNVIGGENGQGRAPLGRTLYPGSTEGARSAGGMNSGRRLASGTGSVLGGRTGQPGRSGSRPFTSGGSGLVRPTAMGADQTQTAQAGRTGIPGRVADTSKSQQRDRRPDYLVEDEETWTRDGRRPLPPVVD
ncbi:hypothetical protein ACFWN1_19860 [Streptomyces sp. NPDC058459]|uniref:hypothetical protein n=1 Tax=Streptomyces sp. NPDC058459 TaxID=3346508 RepID=UPI00364ECC28